MAYKKKVTITIDVSQEAVDMLDRFCKQTDRKKKEVVDSAIKEYISGKI